MYLAGAAVLFYPGVSGIIASLVAVTPSRPLSRPRFYATGLMMAAASPSEIVYWLSLDAALVMSAATAAGMAHVLAAGATTGITAWVTHLSALTFPGRRLVSTLALRWMSVVGVTTPIIDGGYFQWRDKAEVTGWWGASSPTEAGMATGAGAAH